MKLAFCGTPSFAVPTLHALIAAGHQVDLVLSQPDRPVGRTQQLTAPPVKQAALAAGLPVTQPEKIRSNAELRSQLGALAPEAIVVVAYGRIIPPWLLALPRLGCINLHGSLLPRYRGAAPIQWAVAMGDAVILFDRMARQGAPLVVETLAGLCAGTIHPQAQNHSGATYAPLLDREDGRMDFAARTAHELFNRWRGFQPWPGAFTTIEGKKLAIHRMQVVPAPNLAASGAVLSRSFKPGEIFIGVDRFFAACAGNTWIEFLELQLEGKKRLSARELLRGMPISEGTQLGSPTP
jgi:methionyl-tRNA formyltransferase